MMAHTHRYTQHQNPDWSTHAYCTECGFAAPKLAIFKAVKNGSVHYSQLYGGLQEEYDARDKVGSIPSICK